MSNTKTPDQVDVRGPRFAAWITTAVLVITLLVSGVSPRAAAIILGVQSVVFAIGAVAGPDAILTAWCSPNSSRRGSVRFASVNPFPH